MRLFLGNSFIECDTFFTQCVHVCVIFLCLFICFASFNFRTYSLIFCIRVGFSSLSVLALSSVKLLTFFLFSNRALAFECTVAVSLSVKEPFRSIELKNLCGRINKRHCWC